MEIVFTNLVRSHSGETIADFKEAGEYQDTFALSLARDVLAGWRHERSPDTIPTASPRGLLGRHRAPSGDRQRPPMAC
jgi:hypothetical protein